MTWKRFNQLPREEALEELGKRYLNNTQVTIQTIKHCAAMGWNYRLSSSLYPLNTHPDFEYSLSDIPHHEEILKLFRECKTNQAWGVRLSMHPDQFVVLASSNEQAVSKSINELNFSGWLMDQLGCPRNYTSPINIHINRSSGSLGDIADLFMESFVQCDESVRARLVLENEDKGIWNVQNLLIYFDLPITHDNLHNLCNPSLNLNSTEAECAKTWGNVKPLFHYSESHPNKANKRCHADMPLNKPKYPSLYDYEIEMKGKDFAILELEKKC